MSAVAHLRLVEYGHCHCGCGGRTPLARQSITAKGIVKGEPRKYIAGHFPHNNGPDYLERDCGFTTPCWVWQKAFRSEGYGAVRVDGRVRAAHIVYYVRANGAVPEGLELDHLCRNRACCNPAHLEPVTRAENVRRGMKTKLTSEQVREIRALVGDGMTHATAAARFGVSKGNVSHIVTYRVWKDVA